jgi:hypothetical protein
MKTLNVLVAMCSLLPACSGGPAAGNDGIDTSKADNWSEAGQPIALFSPQLGLQLRAGRDAFHSFTLHTKADWKITVVMDTAVVGAPWTPMVRVSPLGQQAPSVNAAAFPTATAILTTPHDAGDTTYTILATSATNYNFGSAKDNAAFDLRVNAEISCPKPYGAPSDACPSGLKCLYVPADPTGTDHGYCAPMDACSADEDCPKCANPSNPMNFSADLPGRCGATKYSLSSEINLGQCSCPW